MKPYYQDEWVTIYHGDAREVLPLVNVEVDVAIVDPPYGQTSLTWDRWVESLPCALLEVRPSSSWWFGSMRMFMEHASEFVGWSFAQDVVWEKHNGSNFHADRFRRVHEQVCQFYPSGIAWTEVYKAPQFTMDATKRTLRRKTRPPHMGRIEEGAYESTDGGPRLMRSVLRVSSTHGYAIHPTQKPVELLTHLVNYSCPEGGTVLDPTAGSGSSLIAARDSGRRAIGIEINEEYCEAAARRMTVFGVAAFSQR